MAVRGSRDAGTTEIAAQGHHGDVAATDVSRPEDLALMGRGDTASSTHNEGCSATYDSADGIPAVWEHCLPE